jgi:SAM-dependent methyltransferase
MTEQIDPWKARWDERYSDDDYAYGENPNEFLKSKLKNFTPGKALFPAEGEGRNAVYAAQLGWTVSAFDISSEGMKKAELLAKKKMVELDYRVGPLQTLNFEPESFDLIALIYAHFPGPIKSEIHHQLVELLKPGGIVIFEAFSKRHLEYVSRNEKVGGPKDLDTLCSVEEIKNDFKNFEIIELEDTEVTLNEGSYHNGTGAVIRFVGKKK